MSDLCECGEGCCVDPADCAVEAHRALLRAAKALMDSVSYDTSGINGQGGNGGLISTDTTRRSDELRQVILRYEAPHADPA